MGYNYKYRQTIVVGRRLDGRPVRKEIRSNNKREFDARVRYYRTLYAKGVQVIGKSFSVEQWAYIWLNRYKKPAVGASQLRNYDILIRLHICPVIGAMDLRDVRPIHVQQVLDDCTAKSKSNMDKLMGALRQMFRRAEIDGMIEYSPARKMVRPVCADGDHRRALSEDEITSLLRAAAHHRGGLWVRIMLQCGARRGEVSALRACDVDVDNKMIHIQNAIEYASANKGTVKATKTAAGDRFVPVPDDLLLDLLRYIRLNGITPHGYLFTNADGSHMSETKVRRLWHSFMRAWDIECGAELYRNAITRHAVDQSITPHYLRHTYATQLYRHGVDLKTAQYLLGHADVRTTANIYSHLSADDAAKIAARTNVSNMWQSADL